MHVVEEQNGKREQAWSIVEAEDRHRALKTFPINIMSSVKFEFHLRYQPTSPGGGYRDVLFDHSKMEVLFDCEDIPIVYQAD